MQIRTLHVDNFRGIGDVRLTDLGSMVVVAGQNGSGKSCLFDAIRLLKSVYGGYQANEWQQWMGEFQISLTNRAADFQTMFNDPKRELRIGCDFRLANDERSYIQENADDLLREKIWRTILPEAYSWGGYRMAAFAAQFRDREPEVAARAKAEYAALMAELAAPNIHGEFFIRPGDRPQIADSLTLSIIFSTFRPTEIGVIDYHGAQRHYGREQVQGINLNLDANEQQRSQSALYNYANKYANVKGEMAGSYVRDILAQQAGLPQAQQSTLSNTLKELFATFFPDKSFLGPQPTLDGRLSFPVRTSTGTQHDLDELSSGEKEILYGYLRIRNSAPRHSIILLDEPELHLNPRLIRRLPEFYRKNLGDALGNQIWLVTHSDALLREVVGRDNYNVFHMISCSLVKPGDSQLRALSATADLDLALVDLIGDLASYRPGGKIVIFEGGGDASFDQRVAGMLFPELIEQANLISGSNRVRVRALHEILEQASSKGQIPFKVYSVTDKDAGPEKSNYSSLTTFAWDVYHIENYFLEPKYIAAVLASLQLRAFPDVESMWDELRVCAEETMQQLIRHDLSTFVNDKLVGAINTSTDPKGADLAGLLDDAVERSLDRLNVIRQQTLNKKALTDLEAERKAIYVESLASGKWTSVFRGRDVLRRFVNKHATTVSYEVFRNLLVSKMKEDSFRPEGMQKVVDLILG